MTPVTVRAATPLELRSHWKKVRPRSGAATLDVALLASYTADPLVPYLGLRLHEAGIPAQLHVGPFNQIVQQCLDDDGEIGLLQPDVLVVLPRFEEFWARMPRAGEPDTGLASDLLSLADVAVEAAGRWESCLLFVLPAIPETGANGVGDHGCADGLAAVATGVREALRRRLAHRPNVYLADCEAAVRAVGSRNAYHPALQRFAKIPYTEEVFAELGADLGGLLRLRYVGPYRLVVVDADSLLLTPTEAGLRAGCDAVQVQLEELRDAGVRLAVRGNRAPAEVWRAVSVAFGESWRAMVDDWVIDQRSPRDQIRDLADRAGAACEHVAVLTADDSLAEVLDRSGLAVPVLLCDSPDLWPAQLRSSGVADDLPVVPPPEGAPRTTRSFAHEGRAALSVEEFVAGLGVSIDWHVVSPQTSLEVAEMVQRTKDFTLGIDHSESDITARLLDQANELLLARVRDRLGDYGPGVAIALRQEDTLCTVDLFLVSCPVLGKGVEEAAMRLIVERATARGCTAVVFQCRATGRNQLALDFLRRKASRRGPGEPGTDVEVRMEMLDDGVGNDGTTSTIRASSLLTTAGGGTLLT